MPFGFLARRKQSKWHLRVDSLASSEALPSLITASVVDKSVLPRAQLGTFTKTYLGSKKRTQEDKDEKLEELIQAHANKEVAFAACVAELSSGTIVKLLNEHFRVNCSTDSLRAYLQGLLYVGQVRNDVFSEQDQHFAAAILPIVRYATSNSIRPCDVKSLFDAWALYAPPDPRLLEYATLFTHYIAKHVAGDLTQFRTALSTGRFSRASCARAIEYGAVLASIDPNSTLVVRVLATELHDWACWTAWRPKAERLHNWADGFPEGSLASLVDLEGPDFETDHKASNKSKWQRMVRSSLLLPWLEAEGLHLAPELIIADTEPVLTVFIEHLLDVASLATKTNGTALLRYIVNRDGLGPQSLSTWQTLRCSLDKRFLDILIQTTTLSSLPGDVDLVIQALETLTRDDTGGTRRAMHKEMAQCIHHLSALLLQQCFGDIAKPCDWIHPARQLWKLRRAIARAVWLQYDLDKGLVIACRSQPSEWDLSILWELTGDLGGVDPEIIDSLPIYIQHFVARQQALSQDTTIVMQTLHSIWTTKPSRHHREAMILVASLVTLPQSLRANCMRDLQQCSSSASQIFKSAMDSTMQGDALAMVSLTDMLFSLTYYSKEPLCWEGLLLSLLISHEPQLQHPYLLRLGYTKYSQWIFKLHSLLGDQLQELTTIHQWMLSLGEVKTALESIEGGSDTTTTVTCILAANSAQDRATYLSILQCLTQNSKSDRIQLLREMCLTLEFNESQTVLRAMTSASNTSSDGLRYCHQLISLCEKSRGVATLRLVLWLNMSAIADEAKRALFDVGTMLQLGVEDDISLPSSAVQSSIEHFTNEVARLVASTQKLENSRSMLKRTAPAMVTAMMEELGLEQPKGAELLMADLPHELLGFVEVTSEDQIELEFPLADPETTVTQRLAFNLTERDSLSLHIRVSDSGVVEGLCVHLNGGESSSRMQGHSCQLSALAPEKSVCCGDPSRLTYLLARGLYRRMRKKRDAQIKDFYSATQWLLSNGAQHCIVCGDSFGAHLHRPTYCSKSSCVNTLLSSELELRLSDVRAEGRVVDLLLTSVYAAASLKIAKLLPSCPPRLNDPEKLVTLLNTIPSTDTLAKAPDLRVALQTPGARSELLYSWICNSYRGFLVSAKGRTKIPGLPNVQQFLLMNSNPETEARFAAHNSLQPRRILYHGTSLDRLYAILVQGLRVLSNTNLMAHGASYGTGIYMAREPSVAWQWSRASNNSQSAAFFRSRPDFCNAQMVLACEHAGNDNGVGHGYHVITDESRLMVRYILIFQRGTPAPRAQDIATPIMSTFNYLRSA